MYYRSINNALMTCEESIESLPDCSHRDIKIMRYLVRKTRPSSCSHEMNAVAQR